MPCVEIAAVVRDSQMAIEDAELELSEAKSILDEVAEKSVDAEIEARKAVNELLHEIIATALSPGSVEGPKSAAGRGRGP